MDLEPQWQKMIFNFAMEGRPSNIPFIALKFYVHLITKNRAKVPKPDWLDSVQEFYDLVQGDPILRMNWRHGIKLSVNTISGKSSKQIFDMMDTVCKTPPAFTHHILVGVPINAIFIEFMQNENGRTFFSHQRVNQALKKVMNDYSKMLQSPFSTKYLTTQKGVGWFSPEADADIHMEWYKCDPNAPHYGFTSWNQWFLREFKEGMRPIGEGTPQGLDQHNVIVNSCESTPLTLPPQPILNVQYEDQFWLKDNRYSLTDMFGGLKYNKDYLAEHFDGGTVYQAFLSALSYHRWHAPVDGTIQEVYSIDGTYYLDQSQFIPYDEGSPEKCESFLSAVAARMVMVIKAKNQKIGKIGIIYIGMAEVSTCIATVKVGQKVKKGQEIGHFMFGGSSHLMIFEKKAAAHLKFKKDFYYENKQTKALETTRQNVKSYLAHIQVEGVKHEEVIKH